ncbi:hypothetical protein KP509_30G062000 [Ceratopteris richardii]|uniref:Uncharacterized protein n=1 Tax=Ceratopteris richardii TaxID=49495 RepID=A0A8T2R2Z6_CERRI|nr:hypothetical protein KP509_30G062000 [Ceratopteris richardii]
MESPAEEIDILLNEIPRATSAPPHFQSSSVAPQPSPMPSFPDVLFERKLPSCLSDSRVLCMSENLNPNAGQNSSSSRSAGITPRVSQASPNQRTLASLQQNPPSCLTDRNDAAMEKALASLSLKENDPGSFQVLLGNRDKVYTPNALDDLSMLNTAPPASSVNTFQHATTLAPQAVMVEDLSTLSSSYPSMTCSFTGGSLWDRSHLQKAHMSHDIAPALNASLDSSVFRTGSSLLKDEPGLSTRSKNLTTQQQQITEQVACQQGYDWNPLQKGSYFSSVVGNREAREIFQQPGFRGVHNVDLRGNCIMSSSSGLSQDSQLLALLQHQKLQMPRQTLEEKLQMQQFRSSVDAGILDQIRYMKGLTKYPAYMTDIGNIHYISGSLPPTYENPFVGSDTKCRYYAQGHCVLGNTCPYLHPHSCTEGSTFLLSAKEGFTGAGVYERLSGLIPSQEHQQRQAHSNGNYDDFAGMLGGRRRKEKPGFMMGNSDSLLPLNERLSAKAFVEGSSESLQELSKFIELEDIKGSIFAVAKDQNGCRNLQRKLDEARPEDVEKIFHEIKDHVGHLMIDPFGNYLVQKLLDACSESHCTSILEAVIKNDDLISISLNSHGTRAVQKLIETLRTPDQTALLISSLKHGVVTLIKDLNGNHVVQRCLQGLPSDDNQFIFDAATSHCVEIASHKHGCCVLQRCLDYASDRQKQQLVTEIAVNSLALSQDQYGNYVVQYILGLGLPWVLAEVFSRLEGSFVHLSMQKFSSNVVEKCLNVGLDESKETIMEEILSSSSFGQLLQDQFGNYVIQSALKVTEVLQEQLHRTIVDAIKPYEHVLKSSPFGKRILSRIQDKK